MEKIVLEVDAELNPDVQKCLDNALQRVTEQLALQLKRTRQGRVPNYTEFSRNAAAAAREVELAMHRVGLQALLVDAQRVRVSQVEYVKVLDADDAMGSYHTRVGTVFLRRPLYRVVGRRNSPTVDLIALQVGALAGGWLPDTAEAMAFLGQQGTSREAEASAKKMRVLPYSRSSFETVTHEVGRRLLDRAEEIDMVLAEQVELPDEAASLSVSAISSLVKPVCRPSADSRAAVGMSSRSAVSASVSLNSHCNAVPLVSGSP